MRNAILIGTLLSLSSLASAQEWRTQLSQNLVSVQAGKMIYEEFGLIKIAPAGYEPAQFQVKIHAEAPQGGIISRDSFVSITTMMLTVVFLQVFAQSYDLSAAAFLEAYDYTELTSPIGTPDLELNLFMTDEGMQFEVVDTASGQRSRNTMTWAEVFAK